MLYCRGTGLSFSSAESLSSLSLSWCSQNYLVFSSNSVMIAFSPETTRQVVSSSSLIVIIGDSLLTRWKRKVTGFMTAFEFFLMIFFSFCRFSEVITLTLVLNVTFGSEFYRSDASSCTEKTEDFFLIPGLLGVQLSFPRCFMSVIFNKSAPLPYERPSLPCILARLFSFNPFYSGLTAAS